MTLTPPRPADNFAYQQSGVDNAVPLIYLPGVHGCWTSMGPVRSLVSNSLHLVEVAYPRNADWTLDHFSDALLALMDRLQLDSAHLAGESFGSLIGWKFGLLHASRIRSLTLVGGFCQAPPRYMAATAALGLSVVPSVAFDKAVDTYASVKSRRSEAAGQYGENPFPSVRGPAGRKATANRMRLIQQSNFCNELAFVKFPLRYIGGANDRVIPVDREIASITSNLPDSSSFDSHLIAGAPHVIIASNPVQTSDYIMRWTREIERQKQ